MAVFSKLRILRSSCEEYVHPWTHSCTAATTGLGCTAIQESLRIYVTVYVLALLMKGKTPTSKDIKGMLIRIIQSTSFLTCHAFSYSLFLCFLRRVLGNFNILTVSFIPAFLASYVSIFLERPSRRGLLSLYVTNVASETVFRMAVWRNLVQPIPYGEVVIFMMGITGLLYFYKGHHSSQDSIYGLMRFVVGPFEEHGYMENREDLPSQSGVYRQLITSPAVDRKGQRGSKSRGAVSRAADMLCRVFYNLLHRMKCHNRHTACPHPFSCAYYTLQGTAKLFSVGYGLQVCLRLLLQMRRLIRSPSRIPRLLMHRDAILCGAFLGSFSGVFRMTSCVLRWLFDRDSKFHAIPGGLLAGLTFGLFPDITIALYVMWKWVQMMYNDGVEKGFLPELPGATVLLYCTSTAILFHAALLEPHNLRPSYWKFLHRISGGWIVSMNRKPLDAFGLESSKSLAKVLLETGTSGIAKHLQ